MAEHDDTNEKRLEELKGIILNEKATPSKRAEACIEKFKCLAKEYILAPKLLDRALALQPEMPEALVQMSVFFWTNEDREKAIEYLNRAISSNPSHAAAYKERGNLYKLMGEKKKSKADYDRYIKLNPHDPLLYIKWGDALKSEIEYKIEKRRPSKKLKADMDKAIYYYSEAIKREPENPETYKSRGKVYLWRELKFGDEKDFLGACRDIERYLTLFATDEPELLWSINTLVIPRLCRGTQRV